MDQNIRVQIQRLGKTLSVVCRIARIFFIIAAILSLMGAVACLAAPQVIEHLEFFFSQNTLYLLLSMLFDPEVVKAFQNAYGRISEVREKYQD